MLLAARHRPRLLPPPLAQDRKQRVDALQRGRDTRGIALGVGAHLEVLEHGHLRQHDAPLRHVREPAPQHEIGTQAGDLLAVEDHAALARTQEADDRLEGRRLAGAVRADDAHDLPGANLERDVVQDVDLAVARRETVGDEQRRLRHGRASQMYRTCGYGSTSTMRWRRTPKPARSSAAVSASALQ